MAILRSIVFCSALALGLAHAAEEPSNTDPAPVADEPDAIDALFESPSPTASGAIPPIDPMQDRINVAAHQIDTREYAEAKSQLDAIIAEVEQQHSRYDPSLIVPLTLLGDALSGQEEYEAALDAYEQAGHITRITEGLHSTEQVDIVYKEADAYAAMGKVDKANDRQEYAYEIQVREYGQFGPGLVPGLFRLAAWYDRTFNLFGARNLYERAVQILSRTNGDNDPSLIPALRGLARTYRDERFPPYRVTETQETFSVSSDAPTPVLVGGGVVVNRFATGETALVYVVKITEANPEARPIDVALAELDLADWYLLFDKPGRAVPVYVHARQLMRERAGMSDDEIAAYFGHPTPLYLPVPGNPPLPPLASRGDPTPGFVEVSYSVDEDGIVDDLKTVASMPEGLMDTKVRHGVLAARFRPRFEGDAPVMTQNQTYRHTFTYYPRPGAPEDQERTASKPARAPAASPPSPQSPDPASAAAAGTPPTEPAPASPDADQIQPRS
ncbi:MAG TPA: tetratricopeptide repeat protein [Pseudomonadales bacterium]